MERICDSSLWTPVIDSILNNRKDLLWYLELNSPSKDETTLDHLARKWFAL